MTSTKHESKDVARIKELEAERVKLLELLKQTRILRNEVTAARPPPRYKLWYDAVEACSDIKTEGER